MQSRIKDRIHTAWLSAPLCNRSALYLAVAGYKHGEPPKMDNRDHGKNYRLRASPQGFTPPSMLETFPTAQWSDVLLRRCKTLWLQLLWCDNQIETFLLFTRTLVKLRTLKLAGLEKKASNNRGRCGRDWDGVRQLVQLAVYQLHLCLCAFPFSYLTLRDWNPRHSNGKENAVRGHGRRCFLVHRAHSCFKTPDWEARACEVRTAQAQTSFSPLFRSGLMLSSPQLLC
jgi:hypothetical protein